MNRRSLFSFLRKDRIYIPEPEEEDEIIDTKHTRRFFFGILAGGAAALVAPPGLITTTIPLTINHSRNVLLTREQITQETLRILEKNLVFTGQMTSEGYRWAFDGYVPTIKIGETLNIRKPIRFRGRHGNTHAA